MTRYQAIQLIMEQVTGEIVVCNLGHPSQELYQVKDRPRNFYMLGTMGLASSIGLGLAMTCRRKIVVIEGEGSVLMNLGTLSTIGANQPDNLCLIIIDNSAYGSTGFQPTFTSRGTDMAKIARSCGIRNTHLCEDAAECGRKIPELLHQSSGPTCIVIETDRGMSGGHPPVPLTSVEIKNRLMESLNEGRNEEDSCQQSL